MTRQAAVEDWPTLRHTFSRAADIYITIFSHHFGLGRPIVRLLFQAGNSGLMMLHCLCPAFMRQVMICRDSCFWNYILGMPCTSEGGIGRIINTI